MNNEPSGEGNFTVADFPKPPDTEDRELESVRAQLSDQRSSTRRRALEKFFLAALGSIPWVGGFISAAASLKFDQPGIRQDDLQTQWLEGHQRKLQDLRRTLNEIAARFDNLGDTIDARIQSDDYLTLVQKAFRVWDKSDTDEKRTCAANLITNAAGTRICSDDVVRLFIDWLDLYHEAHLAVIREIFQHPRCTRHDIWTAVYGPTPREDSAEADLFKLLIRDLSTGGVIRQEREVTDTGAFVRRPAGGSKPRPLVMESAFERTKPYVLTELGSQFVHYTMTEVVPRLPEQHSELS